MNHKENGFAHVIIVIALSVILLLVIGYFWSASRIQVTTNGGYRYLTDIASAHKETRNDINAMVANDDSFVLSIVPSQPNESLVCTDTKPKITTVKVEGEMYDVCHVKDLGLYITKFKHDNQWHTITLLSPDRNELDTTKVDELMSSVTVSSQSN